MEKKINVVSATTANGSKSEINNNVMNVNANGVNVENGASKADDVEVHDESVENELDNAEVECIGEVYGRNYLPAIESEHDVIQNSVNSMIEAFFNEKHFGKWAQLRMDWECGWMLDFTIDEDEDEDGNHIYTAGGSMVHLATNRTVWCMDDDNYMYIVGPDGGTVEGAIEHFRDLIWKFIHGCERCIENYNYRIAEEIKSMLKFDLEEEELDEWLHNEIHYRMCENDMQQYDIEEYLFEKAKQEYCDLKTEADFIAMGI